MYVYTAIYSFQLCGLQPSISNLSLDLLLGHNERNVITLKLCIRSLTHMLRTHLARTLLHRGRIREALVASTARKDRISQISLIRSILMEDLVPVAVDTAKPTGNNLVVDADHARLSKVLHPVGASVAGGRVAVLGVFVLPVGRAAEGGGVFGQGVPVETVGQLVEEGA